MASRQSAVVALWPVPKASPASISMAVRSHGETRAVVAAVHDEAAGRDRRQGGLRQGDPVLVGHALQGRRGEVRAQPRERLHDRGKRRLGVVVGLDDVGGQRGLEQGNGQRLGHDGLVEQAGDGAARVEIGDGDAELEEHEANG